MASVTLFGRIQKNEGEGKHLKREVKYNAKGMEILELQSPTSSKRQIRELLRRSQKGWREQDLVSRHHRTNGKGVQIPVGDISQVEGREGRLGGQRSRLQYLVNCAVPLE